VDQHEYIILRMDSPARLGSRGDFDLGTSGFKRLRLRDAHAVGETRRTAPVQPKLNVVSLNEREAADLARDPDILASALSIPISLIRPMATGKVEDEKAERLARAAGISWGVQEVAADAAPDAGSSITVAVLDTGIDPTHPCFRGVNLTRKNFSSSPNEDDVLGHGTHCAGTIFGRDVEGVRIGVARGVRNALIGKIIDDNGKGNTGAVAKAMRWASDQGAQVISMSLGIDFGDLVKWLESHGKAPAEALSRALSAYRDSVRLFDSTIQALNAQRTMERGGAIVVAAAGNESGRSDAKPCIVDVSLPAAAIGIVSVGALAKGQGGYEIAPFSNANPMLCAPGVGIVSARCGGGLMAMDGTSMAAPHVAGAAILWSEHVAADNPRASIDLVKAKLLANCRTTLFSPAVKNTDRGAGLVQAPTI
jgi:subtilisin family serine protease